MQRVTNPRNRESLFLSFAHQIYPPLLENSSSRFHEILRQTTRCRGRAEWPERGNKRQNSSWSLVFHSSQEQGWVAYVRAIDHKHQTRRNVASRRWCGRHRHPHRWFSGLTDAAQGGHGAPHCNRLENRSSVRGGGQTGWPKCGRSLDVGYLLDCTRWFMNACVRIYQKVYVEGLNRTKKEWKENIENKWTYYLIIVTR